MKHVTNHTARLINLNAGNLMEGVKRLRLLPGKTTKVEDPVLLQMLTKDPFVKKLIEKKDLSVKTDTAKKKEEEAAKAAAEEERAERASVAKKKKDAEAKASNGKGSDIPPPPPPK